MKCILFYLSAVLLLTNSCSKNNDGNPSTNTWTLDGVTHTGKSSARVATELVIYEDGTHAIAFYFSVLPTADGTFDIVDIATSPNEIAISTMNGSAVYSTNDWNTTATVKVSAGKIKVTVPEIYITDSGLTDSVKLTANVSEF